MALHLHEHNKLNLEEAFLDATFTSGKKGAFSVEPIHRSKGAKIVAIAADKVFLSLSLSNAPRLPRASSCKRFL